MTELETTPLDQDQDSEAPEYALYVTNDKVCVKLTCPDPLSDLPSVVSRVSMGFAGLELPAYPDANELTQILQAVAKPGKHLIDQTLIMGEEPQQPEDGRLEWTREFFASGWHVDAETDSMDFWEKVERRSVQEGELLVRLYKPINGKPGLSVFNNKIPVDKPKRVRLRCGKGVRQVENDDGTIDYFATWDGRIRLNDGLLAVDDVYVIKGNVSLETGNIHHTGTVLVEGDIQMCATVEADGDIVVKGMVDPSHIRCGGSLTVTGGIVGDGEHRIEVGGEIQAKYIGDAVIRALGDITVANEISHADIACRGRVRVPRGRIAGGRTMARRGIRISEAGASGSSDTVLVAGLDFTLPDKLTEYEDKIHKLHETLAKINAALDRAKLRRNSLSPQEQEAVSQLQEKARVTNKAVADVHKEMKRVSEEALADAIEEIIIHSELWSGTTLQIGDYKATAKVSIMKPRRVLRQRSRIKILPMGDNNDD